MMPTSAACMPCFVGQTIEAAKLATDAPATREQILREVMALLGEADWSRSPPDLSAEVHRIVRERSGNADPYAAAKRAHNRLALGLLPELERRVAAAPDPLRAALRMVMAANVIDLGINRQLDEADVAAAVEGAWELPIAGDDAAFEGEVRAAGRILYLADNAGELVFDRLLIERLPRDRVILAVRGAPIINDVLRADAVEVGLADLVPIIDNGYAAPGTVLGSCSKAFLAALEAADLVVSKGQGNFETLTGCSRPTWFLLKAKCPVVAELLGVPLGTLVIRREPV